MLSKKILLPIAAFCCLSMSASFQSCETLGQLGGEMDAETRQRLLSGLIIDGMTNLTRGGDSLTALAGVWVAAGNGVNDTVVFTSDGQYQQHYASDSLNYVEKGTYVYYISFRQVLVNATSLYNCLTRKQVKWEQKYVYNAKMLNLSNTTGINTLTLEQLDNDPSSSTYGQSLGATQYSAVKVATPKATTQGTQSNLKSQKTQGTQKTQTPRTSQTPQTPQTPRTQSKTKVIRLR
ncbi:MAG: hypothetical protein IKX59_10045 [Bacteroidales bacterium]|nr:hypothetical protein [Bacteroidales bacterium]